MNDLMVFDGGVANHDTDLTPIEVLLRVDEDGRASARETYKFLQLSDRQFARWAKSNILENDFAIEGEDYIGVYINVEGNTYPDYRLSAPFAKKLCMLSKTERGEQAREYFIKVEDALKNVAQNLPQLTTNELVLKIAENNVELERQLAEVKQSQHKLESKLDTALQVFSRPNIDTWRADMENKIDAIVEAQHLSPVNFRGKLYRELEQTANVFLQSRVSRLRGRLKRQGATSSERKAITKLDVISKDKQLRPIFEGIVRKYQAIYGTQEKGDL